MFGDYLPEPTEYWRTDRTSLKLPPGDQGGVSVNLECCRHNQTSINSCQPRKTSAFAHHFGCLNKICSPASSLPTYLFWQKKVYFASGVAKSLSADLVSSTSGWRSSAGNVSDACIASLTVPTFMMEGEQEGETLHVASSCVITPECYC